MSAVKNWLKKILPPPVNSFMREINRIVALEEENEKMMQQLLQSVERQGSKIKEQMDLLREQEKNLESLNEKIEEKNIY